MTRVLIQAGHSAYYPPYLAGGGGAPGEASWATDLGERLAERLDAAGVDVVLVGSWLSAGIVQPAPPQARADYDLFLSLHYDADLSAIIPGYDTGCLAGRATLDPMGADADRFLTRWCVDYPAATGIPLHQERLNPNITDYYAFRDTSANTPGVLLEHGVGMGLDHDTLYQQIDLIAETDAACVLAHLGVTQPEPQPDPEVPDVSILTPEQAIAAAQALWKHRKIAANPDAALFKAWVASWRSGAFKGLPATPEIPVEPGQVAVQGFDQGAGSWVNGKEVSWDG